MWEINVTDDGTTEIRKVPSDYKNDGTLLLFEDASDVVSEIIDYGHKAETIGEALEEAERRPGLWVEV